jgi:hypothetical protein
MIMSDTASNVALKARQQFLNNADLFSCLKETKDEIFETLMASASLDKPTREEFAYYAKSEYLDQPHFGAREEARKQFQRIVYEGICKAFVHCFNNRALREAMNFTNEAAEQYTEIRYIAGELERPIIAPAAPVLSAAELLEQEVVSDYNGAISTDKMKTKLNNNVAYRNTYKRLAETNRLESRVTTLHDAGKVGG